MRTSEFLEHLRSLNVVVSAEGGALKVSAPKGALTEELKRELGARKEELLALLSAADSGAGRAEVDPVAAARIPRAPRGGPLPLSATQQRLWFLDQMEPGLITYNMWNTATLRGPLDTEALERAVREIVRRHEVLRTTFRDRGGVPEQVVAERVDFEFERMGGGGAVQLSDDELRDELWARLEVPFDLARAPLFRVTLVERSDTEHVLFVCVHHIVFDGLSWGLFFRELKVLYEDYLAGRASSLPELELQYADFAAWQAAYFQGREFERQRRYWIEALGGRLPLLELATDRPRPAIQTYNGDVERHWSPRRLSESLEALGKREGVTLFLVMLAAYQAFLQRYTGQTDLLVGTAMAGRNRAEIEDLMGFFVNTLVLRTSLEGDPTFRELLVRARDSFLGALEHQDMPFERLVDELQPERNLSYSPLFQTLFVLDQDSGHSRTMGAVELEPFVLDNHATRTDLVITAYNGRDGMTVAVEYNTDLFDAATIDRMLSHYEVVLQAVASDPDQRISQLPIQTAKERAQLVTEWNATAEDLPETPVFRQFEQCADRAPDAPALLWPSLTGGDDQQLSYRELDERANRLAHHLAARGARPDTLVGLCLERSVDLLVADLAIQKVGAAYVPLDPGFPRERLSYMVADSGLTLVVTTTELEPLVAAEGVSAVRLDAETEEIAARPPTRPELDVPVTARMYVIYTSGSTGRPKGVELEHRSVSNFLATMAREPGLTAADRWLAVTTLSFDISVFELMGPLVVGGAVILAPKAATGDGESLRGLLERLRPTVMQATPATWRMLRLAGWQGDPELRIFCGGEALPRELADELLPLGREVWNLYGPTEATIWSTIWRVEAGAGPVLIGKPIGNTQVYVLDAGLEPVPVGVVGELWIGGDGLARGYLDRPELTAERFVASPFVEGGRLYRTGDLARWRSEGVLECLGRVDGQVKLRGFRIELGEIESVIAEDPGVTQCAAAIREDTPGDQRLVAYYVAADGPLEVEALRERARAQLPAYMVPSSFAPLEAIPLTPNGKVDRLALARLEPAAPAVSDEEYVAPRNELEERIAGAWAETLGVARVPVHTNFFDLGGHSLLLAQVRVHLQEHLERDVSIIELFQYPTVAGLAGHLAGGAAKGAKERTARRGRDLSAGRRKLAQRRRARG